MVGVSDRRFDYGHSREFCFFATSWIRNEVNKVPPAGKTLLVASPKIHFTHHLMNIRGPLLMNSFPPTNLTLAYWSMLLDIFCPIYEF